MVNYRSSKIYTIRSNQCDEIYIGSTTLSLSARFAEHRRQYKYYSEGKGVTQKSKGCRSRELLQYEDAYIELLEEYPCDTKEQLLKREGEIIRNTFNCVNRCVSGRTNKEWRTENADYLKKYQHEYELKRREQKKQYNKLYRERNKNKETSDS